MIARRRGLVIRMEMGVGMRMIVVKREMKSRWMVIIRCVPQAIVIRMMEITFKA
jgi:hypothetical protein